MTHSKAKSTTTFLAKQASDPICFLKLVRTCDEHQPFITLASLRAKGHIPRSKKKTLFNTKGL